MGERFNFACLSRPDVTVKAPLNLENQLLNLLPLCVDRKHQVPDDLTDVVETIPVNGALYPRGLDGHQGEGTGG